MNLSRILFAFFSCLPVTTSRVQHHGCSASLDYR
jgi:hypothetical protein